MPLQVWQHEFELTVMNEAYVVLLDTDFSYLFPVKVDILNSNRFSDDLKKIANLENTIKSRTNISGATI